VKKEVEITQKQSALLAVATPDTEASAAAAIAKIQATVLLARRFPRDEVKVRKRLIELVKDPELADLGEGKPRWFYTFPRGKAEVGGPSAPLAREIMRESTNMESTLRIFPDVGKVRHIEVEVWDPEINGRARMQDTFRMVVERKDKRTGKTTVRDISGNERELRELTNKRGAILERVCIFKLRPVALVEKVYKEARRAFKASQSKKPLPERRRILAEGFEQKLGIYKDMLDTYCVENFGHGYGDTTSEELIELGGVGTAIRDNASKRDEYFPKKREAKVEPLDGEDENPMNLNDITNGKVVSEADPHAEPEKFPAPVVMRTEISRVLKRRLGDLGSVESFLKSSPITEGQGDISVIKGEMLKALYSKEVRHA
jgi:hypothetical protein